MGQRQPETPIHTTENRWTYFINERRFVEIEMGGESR